MTGPAMSAACPVCGALDHSPFGSKSGYHLAACGACGALFVNPMPGANELAAFYDSYHKTGQYTAKLDSKVRRARRRLRRLRRTAAGRRFIDVGCNVGFAVAAAQSCGFDALGIDIDNAAIESARALFPDCRFARCDVAEVEGSFDVAYCSEVIEHLPEPVPFLAAIRRALAPGGLIYVTTPDMAHRSQPRTPRELLASDVIRPPEHLLYLDRRSTKIILERCGFKRVWFPLSINTALKAIAWS